MSVATPSIPAAVAEPALSVREARREDWSALARFYAAEHAHRPRLLDERRWRWTFFERPAAAAPPFHVLECEGRIVGGIGVVHGDLVIDGAHVNAGHPVNFFVGAQATGLASLRLLRAALRRPDAFAAAYVSESALRLLLKSGFVDLSGALHDHHCTVARPGLGRPGAWPVAIARGVARFAWRTWLAVTSPGLRYRVAASLDDAVTDQFVRQPASIHYAKSADWLRWRYERAPMLSPLFVHQFRRGRPCGLAIVHVDRERGEAILMDALWTEQGAAALPGLLDRAMRAAADAGARVLTTSCCSPALERVLRRMLFRSVQSPHNFVVYARDPAIRARLADAANWHFTLGDTDVV